MKKNKITAIILFIASALLIATGVVFIPEVSDIGEIILYYILAIFIAMYVFTYLVNLAKRTSGTKQILVIIEIVLDSVIALSLIVNEIGTIVKIKESFSVLGLILLLHCMFSSLRGYFCKDKKDYPFYLLVLNLFGLIGSTYIIIKPLLVNYDMLYIMSVISFVTAIVFIFIGVKYLKNKKSSSKNN